MPDDDYCEGLVCEPSDILHPQDWDTYGELMGKFLKDNPEITQAQLEDAIAPLMPKRSRQLHLGYASGNNEGDDRAWIGIQAYGQHAGLYLDDAEVGLLIDRLTGHLLFRIQGLHHRAHGTWNPSAPPESVT